MDSGDNIINIRNSLDVGQRSEQSMDKKLVALAPNKDNVVCLDE